MLKALSHFFDALVGAAPRPAAPPVDDRLLTAAAVLVHVAQVDGTLTDAERLWLLNTVQARTGLADDAAERFVAQASRRDLEAGDVAETLSNLRRSLDAGQKRELVAMMWRMALADGSIHEFEDTLISRACELLGVGPADAAAIRAAEGAPAP
ncbi:tellurite resistance TerB family protein [Alsobacter sp. SYSU BS001988]|jgi:uncharacterized tellurite resistance protein B-like protein